MKGILKIYHPEETLKYHIKNSYCKAVYLNEKHYLEVEIITDDNMDHVEDDSLQYPFPQLSFRIFDFPLDSPELIGKTFSIEDTDEIVHSEADIFTDDEAFLYDNQLSFTENEEKEIQLVWSGQIDDFYTEGDQSIPFKLKCHFKDDQIEVSDE